MEQPNSIWQDRGLGDGDHVPGERWATASHTPNTANTKNQCQQYVLPTDILTAADKRKLSHGNRVKLSLVSCWIIYCPHQFMWWANAIFISTYLTHFFLNIISANTMNTHCTIELGIVTVVLALKSGPGHCSPAGHCDLGLALWPGSG